LPNRAGDEFDDHRSAVDLGIDRKALQEVTLARQASTQLAMAKTITWADDDKVQASLTLIRNTLTSAQTALPTNPAQAAQLLADALTALAAYQQGVPK
jgi:hypothetical protein